MTFRIIDAGEPQLPGIERLEGLCFSMPWTREQIKSQLPDGEHIFLAAVGEADCIAVSWRMFGSGGRRVLDRCDVLPTCVQT